MIVFEADLLRPLIENLKLIVVNLHTGMIRYITERAETLFNYNIRNQTIGLVNIKELFPNFMLGIPYQLNEKVPTVLGKDLEIEVIPYTLTEVKCYIILIH